MKKEWHAYSYRQEDKPERSGVYLVKAYMPTGKHEQKEFECEYDAERKMFKPVPFLAMITAWKEI